MRVVEVSSLRPGLSTAVTGAVSGKALRWREYAETQSDILARFGDGGPALIANDRHHYLACWPDEALLADVMAHVVGKAGLDATPLPAPIRIRRRGDLVFAFNYGTEPWDATFKGRLVMGQQSVGPQEVSIWRAE